MLTDLRNYAIRQLGAEPGFAAKTVAWALSFSEDGRYLGTVSLKTTDDRADRGRAFRKCPEFSFSEMLAGGTPKTHPLRDTAARLVLLEAADDDENARQRFEFHISMLRDAAAHLPVLGRLADALEDPAVLEQIRADLTELKVKPAEAITFRIADQFPLDAEAVHQWWRQYRLTIMAPAEGERMLCLLSGQMTVPAPTHDKIRGLTSVGGLATGDVVVGFDKDAFRSYALEQSANAACSVEAAAEYCAALNDLIASPDRSHRMAGALTVHWYSGQVTTEDDAMNWLHEGASERDEIGAYRKSRELLEAIEAGRAAHLLDNRFYILTISGNSGRVMVRDWMEGRFEQLVRSVCAWFDDLSIVHRDGGMLARAPKFMAVLGATVRQPDDLAAPLISKMWRVAVMNEPLPAAFLAQALLRVRTDIIQDQPPNHARMGLLKAYHLRKSRSKGGDAMSQIKPFLNEEHPSPAYQCGRLMAVLAALQRAALGDVGAGVVQRYYAAASSTPSLVLGRLSRTAQFHIDKLEGGLPYWYESKLAEIWGRLGDAVPRTLNLEQQSLFALGYYQQMADLRTKKSTTDDSDSSQEGDTDA